jgi:hypothetical protein
MRRDPAQAVQMLDQLAEFFENGRRWTRYKYHDDDGNRCLIGALRHLRAVMKMQGDGTGYYLREAQPQYRYKTIVDFNDTRDSYAQISELIERARRLAVAELANELEQVPLKLAA